MPVLAFDLGGTHLRGAVVRDGSLGPTLACRIQNEEEVAQRPDIWDVIVAHMTTFAEASAPQLQPTDPIVISFPGPIAGGRRIVQAPTVCGCSTDLIDLAAVLEDRTGRAVHLLNDISAAAWCLSTKTSADRFMVVTISSGIGSKIFDRHHRSGVLDEPAYAGEIGHMVVDDRPDAPRCDCGGTGHLGAIASGRGIERAARLRAERDVPAFAMSCVSKCLKGSPRTLTNEEHLVPAALRGDAWTLELLRECTRPLARVLLASVMAAGLERVFVIGGFAQALGEIYLSTLRDLMTGMSQYAVLRDALPSIVQAGYTDSEPCLLGCGAYLDRPGARA